MILRGTWPSAVSRAVRFAVWVFGLVAASSAQAQGLACQYEIADVIQGPTCGVFGPAPTVALAISSNGRYVCGYYASCVTDYHEAFVYDRQTKSFYTIPRPTGENAAEALDVNDQGLVVGGFAHSAHNAARSFVYNYPALQYSAFLTVANGGLCVATGINNAGMVCGYRQLTVPGKFYTAFRWTSDGGFAELGMVNSASTAAYGINSAGTCTGNMRVNGVTHPFVWRIDGTLVDLGSPGGLMSNAWGISDNERVVGVDWTQPNPPSYTIHGKIWTGENVVDLPPLPGYQSSTSGHVTSSGIAAGSSRSPNSAPFYRATVWLDGKPFDLAALAPLDGYGTLWGVNSMSDNGLLLADVNDQNGDEIGLVLAPASVTGDVDADCAVNINDLLDVINDWGSTASPADIDQNGVVDHLDLILVILNWST